MMYIENRSVQQVPLDQNRPMAHQFLPSTHPIISRLWCRDGPSPGRAVLCHFHRARHDAEQRHHQCCMQRPGEHSVLQRLGHVHQRQLLRRQAADRRLLHAAVGSVRDYTVIVLPEAMYGLKLMRGVPVNTANIAISYCFTQTCDDSGLSRSYS